MKCIEVEKLLSRHLDGILTSEEKEKLETHLESCLDCQAKRQEYEIILETLRKEEFPELKPYFWERLQPKLKEKEKYLRLTLWKRWTIRAIPVSLVIVLLLTAALLIFLPEKKVELSQTEVLLLRELNPLQVANTLLEEGNIENKNMMLIFTSLEEENSERRYEP
jgi:predicted anti-sigma-YlaC factor YlaD